MYAVFEDGSRQYRVSVGDVVRVDYREAEEGARVEFGRVLLCKEGADVKIGQPVLAGMRVVGEVVDHPSEKVYIQHFRRRKNSRRLKGHRQHFVAVKVQFILQAGQEPPPPAEKPAPKPPEAANPAAPAPTPAPAPAPTA
jgi:large subunit ribosomal protein L21